MSTFRCHAQAIIINGSIFRNSILIYDRDSHSLPEIKPFEIETAATESFNGVILICPVDFTLPTDANLSYGNFSTSLESLVSLCPPVNSADFKILKLPL